MAYDLSPTELRVLGVLMEKSLALPQYYPMTLNAIVNACNQKSNRDPVTGYTESEVSAAISSLRRKEWVDQAEPERNSRAVRFEHRIESRFGWNAAQRALVAELILRGPQTLAEVRSHASRMTHLDSNDYARELLAEFERSDPPLVVELPREVGRSARRFAHLLGGPVDVQQNARAAPVNEPAANTAPRVIAAAPDRMSELESRILALERRIEELAARVDQIAPKSAAGA